MVDFNSPIGKNEYSLKDTNKVSKLFGFFATRYDLKNLAGKIDASKNASENIFNLKKRVNNNDIGTA